MTTKNVIRLRGTAEHNLKDLDLDIPTGTWIAVTGVSGSGKSSLAFDTLFREGQRRYLETMSAGARQFLDKLHRPAVTELSGLPPAIALAQRTPAANPRTTVGTLTGIYDHLRLLFARLGRQHCAACGALAQSVSPETIVAMIRARFPGQTICITASLVEDHRGARRHLLTKTAAAGIQAFYIDGQLVPASPLPRPKDTDRHTIRAVCAQLNPDDLGPLSSAVDHALTLGDGVLFVHSDTDEPIRFATAAACTRCNESLPKVGTRLFSFNSPFGACAICKGLGVGDFVDPELLVKDPQKTLRGGAMVPSTPNGYIVYSQVTIDVLNQVCQAHGFDVDTPWEQLSDAHKDIIFNGSNRIKVPFGKHPLENRLKWAGITAKPREEGFYKGLLPVIRETLKRDRNKNILRFVRTVTCQHCNGTRLNPGAAAVTLNGHTIAHYAALPLSDLPNALAHHKDHPIAAPVLQALASRIDVIDALGLGHLTTARGADTLSGGEAHRLRLATLVDGDLRGVLYVLDEPSVGLHPRDRVRLYPLLARLRDKGNTVLTVEHDEAGMRAADLLIELGPGAGIHGGELLYMGPPSEIDTARPDSRTRAFLTGTANIPVPIQRRSGNGKHLVLNGASAHNLQSLDIRIPLNTFTAVSGVSGAGKSTLVDTILARALRRELHGATAVPGTYTSLTGVAHIKKVIHIDQSPIGRTPRSNPATYTGLLDPIRDLFAAQPEAKAAGLKKGWFSMNVKGGRCEHCGGAGCTSIGMHGFADVTVTCEVCEGRRFSDAILAITWNQVTIAQVLEMTVDEALTVFTTGAPQRILKAMADLGLGYLTLGQNAMTLSGGEAQRVKLATELGRPAGTDALYILDEPTTGLHPADIAVLLQALQNLVDAGHTVLVVEHNPHVLKCADFLIDLGPESGEAGGRIVVQGTPERVAACNESPTGKALAQVLTGMTPPMPLARPQRTIPPQPIHLTGVRTHNLRGFDVTIPANQLTVITGVSGSGKSSLAFDTLYHEGSRRFAAGLSNQARRFAAQRGDAHCDQALGITPTIALGQKYSAANPRATVATRSGISEPMRLLYARASSGDHRGHTITARHFSFNHPSGACPRCEGLGLRTICDPAKLVTNPSLSLWEGALDGTKTGRFYGEPDGQYLAILCAVAEAHGMDLHQPVNQLSEDALRIAMQGTGAQTYHVTWHYKRGKRTGTHTWDIAWQGFAGLVEEEFERKRGDHRGKAMADVLTQIPCETCEGTRLKEPYRHLQVAGFSLPQRCTQTIEEALSRLQPLLTHQDTATKAIAGQLVPGIIARLKDLIALGLGYLTLDRPIHTLSGGELMRLRLASQCDAGLTGVTYVLDEPTAGLHPHDTARLIQRLQTLANQGNTLVVVEHDPDVVQAADHVIELGPGAGTEGGRLVTAGAPQTLTPTSLTGAWLQGKRSMPRRQPIEPVQAITIHKATANNLKNLTVRLPQGLTVVTGVSGSGKSSLIFDVLALSADTGNPVNCQKIEGLDTFNYITGANQDPPGAAGGYPVTRLGIYDAIRTLFAKTHDAKARGFRKSRFALGAKGGRCETCGGTGTVRVDMDFLPDVPVTCETCNGRRFDTETLQCRYKGLTITEVLALTATEATDFFADQAKIAEPLALLCQLGLGYLTLGQPARQLSGGEAKRLKLADALWTGKGKHLILVDEPTTGLHLEDIAKLLALFTVLTQAGHTIIAVEHHPAVIRHAHHVIDLGPAGGAAGGKLVYEGPPEALPLCEASLTGRYL